MQKTITFYVPQISHKQPKKSLQLPRQYYTRNHDCHSVKVKQNIKLDPHMK